MSANYIHQQRNGIQSGVSRRELLKNATSMGAVAIAGGLSQTMSAAPVAAASDEDNLTWMPAHKITKMIHKKDVSPVEVLDHFLARIEEFNPTLKAFKHLDIDGAKAQAKTAERAVLNGDDLGALHGIPISVKEHIAIKGMPVMSFTSGDSPIAERDAVGVARLREAGALLIGTNTMMGTSRPAPGKYNWEEEARSPWDPARAPGWSSSGGASATAAGLLPMTIGSDGGGSTRLPAAISGVVGHHPTVGRIPTVNYDGQSLQFMGTIGPLSRDVRDAAIAMQVMAGPDGRDFAAVQEPAPDYLGDLNDGVRGMKFAWTDDYGYGSMYELPGTKELVAQVREAAMSFNKLGAKVEPTSVVWEDFFEGFLVSSRIYATGYGNTDGEMPSPEAIAKALDVRGRNWQKFRDVLSEHDVLLSATASFTAMTVEDWDAVWTTETTKYPHKTFAPTYTSYTHMFNWLGLPAMSVPAGFIDGLPIGLQIVALPENEAKIFQVAQAFLKANPRNELPKIS